MNLFQIAENFCDGDIETVVNAIHFVFNLIQWAIPAVLIVLGTIDMFKAMASGDEKKTKEAQQIFGRRLIYAVVAFLIPFIISLTFTFVGKMINDNSAKKGEEVYDNFFACWQTAGSSGNVDTTNTTYGSCTTADGVTLNVLEKDCEGVWEANK